MTCAHWENDGGGSAAASEGTVKHTVIETVLKQKLSGDKVPFPTGQVVIEGVHYDIDPAWESEVNFCVDHALSIGRAVEVEYWIEPEIDISDMTSEKGASGHADLVMYVPYVDNPTLYVLDWKTGHKFVPASSSQLKIYAAGWLATTGQFYDAKEVVLQTVMPARDQIEQAEFPATELLAWASQVVPVRAQAWRDKEEDYHPTTEACQWCAKKATCPGLTKFVMERFEFKPLPPEEPKSEAYVVELGMSFVAIGLIEQWIKAVEKAVKAEVVAGRGEALGYKLVRGRKGPRAWLDEAKAEAVLRASRLPVDALYSKHLISPAQAEKVLKGKPRIWKRALEVIGQSDGALQIAPLGDKREAVSTAQFETLPEEE